MPAPLNQIGPHRFMLLDGPISFPSDKLLVDFRLGVKGLEFTETNARGEPFQLFSRVDAVTREIGINYFWNHYRKTITQGLLDLTISDYAFATIGVQCKVIDVHFVDCRRVPFVIGGLGSGTQAILEARWDLALLETPADESE